MKKLNLLFALLMISAMSFGQVFTGVNWINWGNEPDYPDVTGYDENPYENPEYTVFKAPAAWAPIADVASFDATWDLLGDENHVANLTSNGVAGDLFDLGTGNTFGASWKAVHDGAKFYVLLKYWDLNAQTDDGSMSFEIMAQPTSPVRHDPTFQAGVDAEDMAKKNMAYGRYVELGGGKALFKATDGLAQVTEYAASVGLTGGWGANEFGLGSFLDEDLFWEDADGVIRAVLVMAFDGALSYPTDANDPNGDRTAIAVGDIFAFDVKSNATIGGTEGDNRVEYFWSADKNNGYGSNYYSGHLTLSEQVLGEAPSVVFTGVNWVNWGNEPDYADVTGYAENPYDNPEYTVFKAPATWTPVADVASFDATWDLLGDENHVANLTSNGVAGDIFDLGTGNTFGAAWKAVHDGSKMYVLLKYWDLNAQTDDGSMTFEIMAQPSNPVRHNPTFQAGVDADDMAKKNMAYGRYVELGGGKALFKATDGLAQVTEYAASVGLTGGWGANEFGLGSFLDENLFWDETDGLIRAVLIMSFNGALSYPTDPSNPGGDRTDIQVGETFAFDVKSNSTIGGTEGDNRVEYFWSADKNNGYASNYYSGHLTLSATELGTNVDNLVLNNRQIRAYMNDGILYINGNQTADVEVYNIVGAKLKSVKSVNQLNMQDLNNGIYLIRLNGETNAIKVVKH